MTTLGLQSLIAAILMGMVATILLDTWALALKRLLNLPSTNWAHVGRWVVGLPAGVYRSEPIGTSPTVSFERTIGWATHYVVGAIYGVIYLAILGVMSQTPSVYSAALFGLATVVAPWFILQPGLGLGVFARRSQKPNLTRTLNVVAHVVFGVGLYTGWQLASFIL